VSLEPGASSTVGLKTGAITVDNLELTSDGAGTGSLDGDDVIFVSVNVVDCNDPATDTDGDDDVDMIDFSALQLCLTGSDDTAALFDPIGCGCFDHDGDLDVDASDVSVFVGCLSGANVSADPGCDND
jgi:hypothetical protein